MRNANFLSNCKVELVISPKFHPARHAAIGLSALILFAWLAQLASRGTVPDFDLALRGAIHAYARPWVTLLMKAASFAGGGWVLWPGGALIFGLLRRARRAREAASFAVTVLGANLVNELLKLLFHRPRPEPWFGYPAPTNYSFPSGHAFMSFCFCLCLAEILLRRDRRVWARVAIWCAAAACALAIGLSRIYLGVHYPTDVLGGYAAGVVWTTLVRVAGDRWQEKAPARDA
jgi:undecaprenyl-diphosphatase